MKDPVSPTAPAPAHALALGHTEAALPQPGPRGLVSILLPAKNEEEGLARTLASLPIEDLTAMGYGVEVVVVDGRSEDRTLEVATSGGARIIVQEGKGKGMAVRTARRYLRGDFIVMLDSDDTYPAESIPEFVEALEKGADVVMGSRLKGHIVDGAMSPVNRMGNRLLSLLASIVYGRRCTDVCTGMWGFRREALARVPLTSRYFEIEAEMFARFSRAGFKVVEVPILYRLRAGDTKLGKFKDGFLIGLELVKQRFTPNPLASEAPAPAPVPARLQPESLLTAEEPTSVGLP